MTDTDPIRPRLPLLSDEELAARGFAPTAGEFVRVFGHAADTFRRWSAWYAPIIADGAVESRIKEICRMRVAQLNDCAV